MGKKKYIIITFHTSSDAMLLEKEAKNRNILGKLIPAPRSITPGCGMAYRAEPIYFDDLKLLIDECKIEVDEMLEYEF